jgi:hypothetical protein
MMSPLTASGFTSGSTPPAAATSAAGSAAGSAAASAAGSSTAAGSATGSAAAGSAAGMLCGLAQAPNISAIIKKQVTIQFRINFFLICCQYQSLRFNLLHHSTSLPLPERQRGCFFWLDLCEEVFLFQSSPFCLTTEEVFL